MSEEEKHESSDDSDTSVDPSTHASDWHPFCFSTSEATFFAHSKREWYEVRTQSKGSCGLDSIAVALGLPRTDATFGTLRFGASMDPRLSSTQKEKICQPKEWIDDEQMAFVVLNTFQKIPIILSDRFDAYALPLPPPPAKPPLPPIGGPLTAAETKNYEKTQAEYQKQLTQYRNTTRNMPRKDNPPFIINQAHIDHMPTLLLQTDPSKLIYVVFKNKGAAHWVTLGTRHKHKRQFRTKFTANQLPANLLTAFNEQYTRSLQFFQSMNITMKK